MVREAGYLSHIVDVAPNHSGIVMGMACSVSVVPSIMSNMIPQVGVRALLARSARVPSDVSRRPSNRGKEGSRSISRRRRRRRRRRRCRRHRRRYRRLRSLSRARARVSLSSSLALSSRRRRRRRRRRHRQGAFHTLVLELNGAWSFMFAVCSFFLIAGCSVFVMGSTDDSAWLN